MQPRLSIRFSKSPAVPLSCEKSATGSPLGGALAGWASLLFPADMLARVCSRRAGTAASISAPIIKRSLIAQRPLCTTAATAAATARGLIAAALRAYSRASTAAPLATAFATCLLKGSASDTVAQLQIEGRDRLDLKRNFSFAFFSGAYLGIGQHLIYNVAFTRIFGSGTDILTGVKKVVADSTVHVPMIYLPLYYPFKMVVLGEGTARDGLTRYRADVYDVMTTYWSMWPMVHFISFTYMPQELRIGFVASVSFVWLVYLSYASHKEPVTGTHQDAAAGHCSLH